MFKKTTTFLLLVGIGIFGRLLPHPPNATPITAITQAARTHLGRTWAYIVPLAAMLVSDAVIGFYNWKILVSVYGSFLVIAYITYVLRKQKNMVSVIALAVASSLCFFLITNTAVWLFSPWYEKSLAGLLYCLALGIPFLRAMFLGDALYLGFLYFYEHAMTAKIKHIQVQTVAPYLQR